MKLLHTAFAVAALACAALPVAAQDAEQSRTTWRIQLVDLKDGAGTGFEDLLMDRIIPAYEAAGLPAPQLHWAALNDDYDYVVITQVPGGMATFDSHAPAARTALNAALVRSLGSEEAVTAMYEEMAGYVESSTNIYTHSHP
jgi:hypothetical protein